MRTRLQQKVPARSFESLLEDGSVGCSLSQLGDNQGTSPGWCHPCPKPSSLGTAQLRPFFLVAHFPAPHPGVPAGWAGGHRGHRQGVGSPVQCWALPPWDRDTGRSLPVPPGQGIWCPLLLEGWDGDPEPGIPLGAAWGLPGCVRPWHPWAKVWVQISSPGMLPGHSQVGCGGLEWSWWWWRLSPAPGVSPGPFRKHHFGVFPVLWLIPPLASHPGI